MWRIQSIGRAANARTFTSSRPRAPCFSRISRLNASALQSTRRHATAAAQTIETEPATLDPIAPPHGSHHVSPPTCPQLGMDESFIGMTGGQIFHEMMRRQGVKHIFGYPGGAILPVFDAIHNSPHFDFVLPKHEQCAGHMAEGYARASGKPGVVIVTSGPGATNIITPLQDALSDGTPMVVFAGQVATSAIGSDAFQEADILGMSRSCTKWNVMVRNVAEIPQRINEAFQIATSGRPGPVLVDLPKDVTASILQKAIPTASALPSSSVPEIDHTTMESITRAAHLINKAKKPVIYAGQGVLTSSNGPALLKALAEKASLPVTTTMQGLGAFDEHDPKSLHMLGMHGSAYANLSMQEADVIIALGARFDDRVTLNIDKFAPAAKAAAARGAGGIIHFEISPKNINKVVQATEAIVGDLSSTLPLLLPYITPTPLPSRSTWFDQINAWKTKYPLLPPVVPSTPTPTDTTTSSSSSSSSSTPSSISPQTLITHLSTLTSTLPQKTIITTGVGQHQMWTAQHYRFHAPQTTLITSGGLGTMGFGLPAAIGAKVAHPGALVIDIDGDASFAMTMTELSTAAQFGIGVRVLLL
ncbi:acetolactate synthase, partial [Aspergillus ellipticus CBS 707.79]